MIHRAVVFAVMVLAAANTGLAQPRDVIGRFVVDVRGASAGLPAAEGWTPPLPIGTVVPSRGLGVEAGAHVYVARFRWGALGVGATWLMARATTSAPEPASGAAPSPTEAIPDVTTRATGFAPQLSLNFGHSLGWSYLSAGYGVTNVRSERTATSVVAPALVLESGWTGTINFGGGARWFVNDHLGAGFDLRWHKLPLLTTYPGAGRPTLVVAGVGIVLK